MWPFTRRLAVEREPWTPPPCWRSYELPAGRTWESFRYLVEDMHNDTAVDELVTDSDAERDRLVRAGLEQGYGVRVTDRTDGSVTVHPRV